MRHHIASLTLVASLAALGLATPARAHSPCDDRALADGPLPVGFSQRDFGIVPGACPRTSVGLALDARATIENENFYGNIRAAGRFDGSIQPFPQLELSLTSELLAYQLVIQSFKDDYVGLGDTSVSAKLLAFARQRFAIAMVGRATLPTAIGYYGGSWPVGLEAGPVFLLEPFDMLRLHGGLLVGQRFALTKADSDPHIALIANTGLDLVVFDWFSLVLDLNGQALERGDLDHLAAAPGARFVLFDDVGLEVGANIPFAGDERNLAAFLLRASYRFE